MAEDDETPTDKPPMPPIPAPTGDAPTIEIEADDAGELHEAPTVPGEAGALEAISADDAAAGGAEPPTDAPTVPAGALEADAGDDQGEKLPGLCGAKCGTSEVACELEPGHEDPEHPAHIKNDFGEAMHQASTFGGVRWAVDAKAAEVATRERNRQLLEEAQRLDRLSKAGHE